MSIDLQSHLRSKYMNGDDLEPRKQYQFTIAEVYEHTFQRDNSKSVCLSFDEHTQHLVMNKTRLFAMVEMFGDDTNLWVGQRITLQRVPSGYQNKPTIQILPAQQRTPTMNSQPTVNGQRPPAQSAQYSRGDHAASQQPPDWATEPPQESDIPF